MDKDSPTHSAQDPSKAEYNLSPLLYPRTSYKKPKYQTKLPNNYCIGDIIKESFRSLWDFDIGWKVEIFHVMRAFSFLSNITFSCAAEGFDGVGLALLHFDVGVGFDARYGFAGMDVVGID